MFHYFLYFCSHFWFVTMYRAFATCCFSFLEGTLVQPYHCIVKEFLTFWTKFSVALMMVFAVDFNHGFNRFSFSNHSWMNRHHMASIYFNEIRLEDEFM